MAPLVQTWIEAAITDGWMGGHLLAGICAEVGRPATEVMETVRRLGLPDRHPTTRELLTAAAS